MIRRLRCFRGQHVREQRVEQGWRKVKHNMLSLLKAHQRQHLRSCEHENWEGSRTYHRGKLLQTYCQANISSLAAGNSPHTGLLVKSWTSQHVSHHQFLSLSVFSSSTRTPFRIPPLNKQDVVWICKLFEPFKNETCLFYIRTQCVPRSKHSPLRL
jgi:hypothetical protein